MLRQRYMRSVSFWGKFTSGSRIRASRNDLLKLPNFGTRVLSRIYQTIEIFYSAEINFTAVTERAKLRGFKYYAGICAITETAILQYRENNVVFRCRLTLAAPYR